jgi:hypothetical protein
MEAPEMNPFKVVDADSDPTTSKIIYALLISVTSKSCAIFG